MGNDDDQSLRPVTSKNKALFQETDIFGKQTIRLFLTTEEEVAAGSTEDFKE